MLSQRLGESFTVPWLTALDMAPQGNVQRRNRVSVLNVSPSSCAIHWSSQLTAFTPAYLYRVHFSPLSSYHVGDLAAHLDAVPTAAGSRISCWFNQTTWGEAVGYSGSEGPSV